jgi:hypothetical protein
MWHEYQEELDLTIFDVNLHNGDNRGGGRSSARRKYLDHLVGCGSRDDGCCTGGYLYDCEAVIVAVGRANHPSCQAGIGGDPERHFRSFDDGIVG